MMADVIKIGMFKVKVRKTWQGEWMMYSTVSIRFVIQDYTKGVQNSSGVLLALGGGVCVCVGGGAIRCTL